MPFEVITSDTVLGAEHMLLGIDHLLFVAALAKVDLPQNSIPLALLFFNIGVEIGQLLFVVVLLVAAARIWRLAGPVPALWSTIVPAYAFGGISSFWVVDRVFLLWSV